MKRGDKVRETTNAWLGVGDVLDVSRSHALVRWRFSGPVWCARKLLEVVTMN